jgi:predicted dehydrogenase
MTDRIGIGIVGAGWMGHVHARAYARLRHHFPTGGRDPELIAAADPVDAQLSDLVRRHGIATGYADWRDLVADPRIGAVSVTAPNHLHAQIGVAVAEAGKHLWIEKPVGLNAADAEAVRRAVQAAGVSSAVGFNYRNVPAVMRARSAIDSGAIGRPTHARVHLFTDYAAHPGGPMSWRFALDRGGHGVLGDLASHGIDLVRFLLGDVDSVVAITDTFVPRRPLVDAGSSHYAVVDLADAAVEFGSVENEDYVAALLRTESGVAVVVESSRAAVGEQNHYGFEVHGTTGLVRWDFRRPGELSLSTGADYQGQSTSTVLSGPGDGEYAAFQPGAGITMSFDDTKVIEAWGFLRRIDGEHVDGPTIDDAVASARVLDAIVTSAADRRWVSVGS